VGAALRLDSRQGIFRSVRAAQVNRTGSARIAARDLPWLDLYFTALLGPLKAPAAADLRAAVQELSRLEPDNHIFRRIDRGQRRWLEVATADLPAHCDRMVVECGPVSHGAQLASFVEAFHRGQDNELPFRLGIAGDYVVVSASHAIGDWWTAQDLWSGLLGTACSGGTSLTTVAGSYARFPLLRALGRAGRHPAALLGTLRHPPGNPPVPHQPFRREWRPDTALESAFSSPSTLTALKSWGQDNAPDTTVAVLVFSACWLALGAAGLSAPPPGMYVLYDNRRTLPPGTRLNGNFVVGVYVKAADPGRPVELDAAMRASFAADRPLTLMAAVVAKSRVVRRTTKPRVSLDPRPVPAMTHLGTVGSAGRMKQLDALPWKGQAADRRLVVATTPPSDGITFCSTIIGGRLHVSATFHATTFGREQVRRAVEAAAHDPVGLLRAHSGAVRVSQLPETG
jgi:hypothetical protein